ncbi:hypothetical protein QR680_002427 [Steinernema hermaphroditum]|uniref:MAM domain-containing protein n=1 Tax=Steinernema hermaphroditum TaxID=289476 RepID=A0AA39H3J7_9BILA|nr:hypothetical protein QR680_002427 [Steinernema hermaphroditum]
MTSSLLNLFFLVVLLSGFAEACMPGYEAEREKLHEYLGIEWVPMGLHNSAESSKPIRHSSDLNCNFDDPAECRWRNAKGDVDSLDFHLFKKTEHTEFPVLQVRPGPSKVREGEQLIFVGDRKRSEKSAIYYSSPIPCQNNTGILTFTFWVYNEARVEVVIVELDKGGNVVVLPEKPYVDCGTVHLNTECSVNIPPREQPFRLGIRAYDIKNAEGSFVMIDNIIYDASLCKVNIDFGSDFKTSPLITASQGEAIKASSELNCDSFAAECRWRDGGNGSTIWKRAENAPSPDLFFNATGTYITPKGSFALLYIEQNSKAPFRYLKSDPVQCQSNQEAVLSMRFWATKEVVMSVCAVNMDMEDLECHKVPMSQSPSPVELKFQQTSSFFFVVRVDSVNPDFDSMVAIDDISYRAVLCSEALSVYDFGSSYYTTPLLSLILNKPIYTSKDLRCSFERRGIDCNWANLNDGEGVQWEVGSGPINTHKFLSLTQSSSLPDDEFGVVNFTRPGQSVSLVSETIKCNPEQSTLSFRQVPPTLAFHSIDYLAVCLLDGRSPEVIDCQTVTVSQQGGSLLTDIPVLSQPFRISFRAEADGPGMVIVDDISFNGVVCPSVRQHGTKTKSLSSLSSAPDSNVCRLLSCDFAGNAPCLYKSERIPKSLSMFKVQNNRMETTLFEKGPVSILESPVFHLNAPARLHFDYIKQHGNVTLFVCQDSSERELDKCFPIDSEEGKPEWKHDFMAVLPSDTKLYWIAKLGQNAKKARLAIDNIVMTDEDDNKVC